jgi:hypothetical protein
MALCTPQSTDILETVLLNRHLRHDFSSAPAYREYCYSPAAPAVLPLRVALAERKKAFAAAMSRRSLNMASIKFPSRSIDRYR